MPCNEKEGRKNRNFEWKGFEVAEKKQGEVFSFALSLFK